MKKRLETALAALITTASFPISSYATTIRQDAKPSDFDAFTISNAPGYIMGVAFWILRIVGVVLLIAGIGTTVSARKDGEADEINVGVIKIVAGVMFLGLPNILKALGVISF